jgi:NADH-quinone oxidoreductase subunit C
MELAAIVDKLKEALPGAVLAGREAFGDMTLTVESSAIRDVCAWLKGNPDAPFNLFIDICGQDRFPKEPRFRVIYHVYAFPANLRLRLEVEVGDHTLEIDSVVPVWKGADWFEREVFDMFGVRFSGHPDLRRLLSPDEYGDHPMRKDFPLEGKFRIESPDDLHPWETGRPGGGKTGETV